MTLVESVLRLLLLSWLLLWLGIRLVSLRLIALGWMILGLHERIVQKLNVVGGRLFSGRARFDVSLVGCHPISTKVVVDYLKF